MVLSVSGDKSMINLSGGIGVAGVDWVSNMSYDLTIDIKITKAMIKDFIIKLKRIFYLYKFIKFFIKLFDKYFQVLIIQVGIIFGYIHLSKMHILQCC